MSGVVFQTNKHENSFLRFSQIFIPQKLPSTYILLGSYFRTSCYVAIVQESDWRKLNN